jgi:hypothetical protein
VFDHCSGQGGAFSRSENSEKPNSKKNSKGVNMISLVARKSVDTCRESWAFRILDSTHVYLYGGGFYSFFQDYKDTCAKDKSKVRLSLRVFRPS